MYDSQIVMISRAHRYSPNSVEKDTVILHEVGCRLLDKGLRIATYSEDEKEKPLPQAEVYVTMGRDETVLQELKRKQQQGAIVINSPEGIITCCQRYQQMKMLESAGINVAPHKGNNGYWVKRGDASAQTSADVLFRPDYESAMTTANEMKAKGITEIDIRAHITGDLVKFYGVTDTDFFCYYYPGDDGQSKFGDEQRNGKPAHYPFDKKQLQQMVNQAATLLQTGIYGGDCIIQPDGTPVLIDFNDWPSFSRCRTEAAQAIAEHIVQKAGLQTIKKGNDRTDKHA